jgi:hypothetical protein
LRENGAIGAALVAAIARHKAAVAAMAACFPAYESVDEEGFGEACNYEDEVSLELALMPCASNAEFFEKLKYVLAREIVTYGDPDANVEFGHTVAAVAQYLGITRDDAARHGPVSGIKLRRQFGRLSGRLYFCGQGRGSQKCGVSLLPETLPLASKFT